MENLYLTEIEHDKYVTKINSVLINVLALVAFGSTCLITIKYVMLLCLYVKPFETLRFFYPI